MRDLLAELWALRGFLANPRALLRTCLFFSIHACLVQSWPWPKPVTKSWLKSRSNFCKSILIAQIHSAINSFKKAKLQSCWKSVQKENNNLLYFHYLC